MNHAAKEMQNKAKRIVAQKLESLQRAGVTHFKKKPRGQNSAAEPAIPAKPDATLLAAAAAVRAEPAKKSAISTSSPALPGKSLFDSSLSEQTVIVPQERSAALEVIQREVAACTRCSVLAASRTQTVFGVGSPTAQICFFGEAPGADEDKQGIPFVGRAGQLLTKMIQACKLTREEVYILNVLKCRPPENRNPLPDEAANCRGYFDRQFEIIRPEIICCLGAVAAKTLLNTETSIGKLRGKFHDYRGMTVVCTYHPAYLLRNPAAKTDAWEDLKMMMRRLGVEL